MSFARGWKVLVAIAAMSALLAVGGCSDDDDNNPVAPKSGTVSVNFDNQVAGVALQVDETQFLYTNSAGNNYSVSRLEYFVSDITLHRSDGSTYGLDDYHIRDAAKDETRTWTIDGVPSGTYTAVSFTFGLDADKNKSGPPISDDAEALDMGWPPDWGGGWHYMVLEGKYKEAGTGTEYGYRTHSGRRMLTVDHPMANPPGPDAFPYHHVFRPTLTLPSSFKVDGNNWEISVVMDVNGWYDNPEMDLETLFPQGAGGIMINVPVQQQLQANGPSCFSITAAVGQ